jgi:two-component system, LytTR family, sensor kinase
MKFIERKYLVFFVHTIIWVCLFFYPFLFHYVPLDELRGISRIGLFLVLQISFFYANSFLFIPRILGRKKVFLYLVVVLTCISIISVSSGYIQKFLNPDFNLKPQLFSRAINTAIIASLLAWFISSAMRLTSEWFRNQQLIKEVENEKLNTELNFLKSQVNPHFLFNALNNIYSLETKKSPETGTAILKLSELIRYMLYESSSEFVNLSKEIEYLQNYIELQKLGISESIKIDFKVVGEATHKKIRPMLFIPVIENVFKHGISYQQPSKLEILLEISEDRVELKTSNTYLIGNSPGKEGIGLPNLKKRLELLYNGKYKFEHFKSNGTYYTRLILFLK